MTDTTIPERDATLRDGRTVHIRALNAADEAEALQAFERLSPETRYMRFMRVVREPDRNRLHKALVAFPEAGVGIVATVPAPDGIDIVGSTVCLLGTPKTRGEFAITVADAYGSAGLGRTLMETMIEAARRRGLEEMEGFVLSVNEPMLKLAARVGFSVAPDPDDHSLCICRLSLV
jgi:acetyltransferase